MTASPEVGVELGRALTGETLPLTASEPELLVSELAQLGWDAERLADLRHQRQAAGLPWPFPVASAALAEVGFAVFHAKLDRLRELLGLTGLQQVPRAQRPWTADEQRLAAERPPHWG